MSDTKTLFKLYAARLAICAVPAALAQQPPSATVSIISPPSLSTVGTFPNAQLLTDTQGNFYGSLEEVGSGGADADGALFALAPNGGVTNLHAFTSAQGYPEGPMIRAGNGTLYGVTYTGGANGSGSIFSLAADGAYSVLYSFSAAGKSNSDGSSPVGLTLGKDGAFYGATKTGGTGNSGTIFRITAAGQFKVIYTFTPRQNAGAGPCTLIIGSNGLFYGTTSTGEGTVFSLSLAGKLTTLHQFSGKQTGDVCPGLVQGTGGNFYGTTFAGTASAALNGNGTIFKMTPIGTITFLHSFSSGDPNADGAFPAGLMQAADGNLYGVAQIGGTSGAGTLFQMTTSGSFTNLYSFPLALGGQPFGYPIVNVIQGADGALYGTTNGFSVDYGQEIYSPTVFRAVINP